MPSSISRRAAVKYALATLVSLVTSTFSWPWPQCSTAESRRQLLKPLTSDWTLTASAESSTLFAQVTVQPINDSIRAGRFSPFLHNAYYLTSDGKFHQLIIEATRSFRTDQAIQFNPSDHSLLSSLTTVDHRWYRSV